MFRIKIEHWKQTRFAAKWRRDDLVVYEAPVEEERLRQWYEEGVQWEAEKKERMKKVEEKREELKRKGWNMRGPPPLSEEEEVALAEECAARAAEMKRNADKPREELLQMVFDLLAKEKEEREREEAAERERTDEPKETADDLSVVTREEEVDADESKGVEETKDDAEIAAEAPTSSEAAAEIDMVEGDELRVLVEVFRIPEEESSKREKVKFVHDSMVTFARSWIQLMEFEVWIFGKHKGVNCGSSTTDLERIIGKTSKHDRYIASYEARCLIEYHTEYCEVESWPITVDYEIRIQKLNEKLDFDELSKLPMEEEVRARDEFFQDSLFEMKMPPPHVFNLSLPLSRPFEITTQRVESGDEIATRLEITITNKHPYRKLEICDVHFLLEPKTAGEKKRTPMEKAFKWYWLAREPTPRDIEPDGKSWTLSMDIYAMKLGHVDRWYESPFDVAFSWYDQKNEKPLDCYPSKHKIRWQAPKSSIAEEKKTVIDLDKCGPNPYAHLLPLRPDPPPPPVQKPEFEVPPEQEFFRVRRIFQGVRDPITGIRVFPPPDPDTDEEEEEEEAR